LLEHEEREGQRKKYCYLALVVSYVERNTFDLQRCDAAAGKKQLEVCRKGKLNLRLNVGCRSKPGNFYKKLAKWGEPLV
jgi:hypothetical protein